MLFRKNKRNQPSEADVKAIEERIRAARDRITSRRPGEPGRGPTPGALRSLSQAAAPGEPVMPSQVPTTTTGPTAPAAAAPPHEPPTRVLPGDIPTYLTAGRPLQRPAAETEQQRLLPFQVPSHHAEPDPQPFSFPVPPSNWERS